MKVLVFGGTHGNEWTGIMAVQHYAESFKRKHPELDLHFILANEEAYKLNKRFKDEDLNRAFQFLQEDRKNSYEHNRAHEIKGLIEEAPCFVVDLHTTTSNMGSTVILSHLNKLNLQVAASLSKDLSDCRIISSPDPQKKFLASQSEHGLMIEVGPVPNGVINPNILESTLEILDKILMFLLGPDSLKETSLDIYEEIQDIYYPQDENGQVTGHIHPSFQGQDFKVLDGHYLPFKTFKGEVIELKTKEKLFPIFINEAAYYPQKLAYTLCRKVRKSI